jgi:hypothetical protein
MACPSLFSTHPSRSDRVRLAQSLILVLGLACASGCADPSFGFPRFFGPQPPLRYQQLRAMKFDPYAEYGPALGESRPPRGFGDVPLPEATRGRWPQWGAPRFGFE